MRIITVGDIHGKSIWKEIKPEKYDKIIFIGDYVDAFKYSDGEILYNLNNIIRFKEENSNKVVLLLGNHDIQYMFSYNKYGCSGYRHEMYPTLHILFNEKKNLFLPYYYLKSKSGQYLWTHAGIHEGWYTQYYLPQYLKKYELQDWPIEETLLEAFYKEERTLFQVGHLRGGFEDVGGIFWADMRLTSKDPLKNYHQIVGHTRTDEIKSFKKDETTSITFVDCLDSELPDFYEQIMTI